MRIRPPQPADRSRHHPRGSKAPAKERSWASRSASFASGEAVSIQAAPARVWQECESFDRLVAWFGRGHQLETYEPELGGQVLLSVEIGGSKRCFGGPILVFEPARELTFSNNWESDGWPVPTLITLRLTALYDACHVELFHHGFERLGSDAGREFQAYEAAWDSRHLDALKEIVES